MRNETTSRFLHAFWGLRQRMLRSVGPVLRDAHDLAVGELMLLDYVAGSDLSPTEIAAALDLPPHTVSRRVGALEARALLRRAADPDDARRRVLTLTEAGAAALEVGKATLHREIDGLLGALEPERLHAFLDGLERLADGPPPSAAEPSDDPDPSPPSPTRTGSPHVS